MFIKDRQTSIPRQICRQLHLSNVRDVLILGHIMVRIIMWLRVHIAEPPRTSLIRQHRFYSFQIYADFTSVFYHTCMNYNQSFGELQIWDI